MSPGWFARVRARAEGWPVVGLLLRTAEKAQEDGGADAAAGIAYFSFLSLFPLLLGVVSVAGVLHGSLRFRQRLDSLVAQVLPGSASFVDTTLDSVARFLAPAGVISALVLLWSASRAFGSVSRVIHRAWEVEDSVPFYASRIRYFALAVGLAVLVVAWVLVTGALELLLGLAPEVLGAWGLAEAATRVGGRLASFAFLLVIFAILFKVVPRPDTPWRAVLPGAFAAALLIEVGKLGFVTFLDTIADFEAVYGSLSSAIVLLIWLYYAGWVVILGAELNVVRTRGEATRRAG